MGTLYIVATPIGNLEDITFRAVRVLMEVDTILAEDTRSARKLLEHFNIKKPLLSYWQHNHFKRIGEILGLLRSRRHLALITEAGTPGISDPGGLLVSEIVQALGSRVNIVPVPGPNAAISALSVSGFPADRFVFLGFPPHKRKRSKFFQEVAKTKISVVIYESPHRLLKTIKDLEAALTNAKDQERRVVVCKELTKQFEYIFRGTIDEVLAQLEDIKIRGEFVIVVGPQ